MDFEKVGGGLFLLGLQGVTIVYRIRQGPTPCKSEQSVHGSWQWVIWKSLLEPNTINREQQKFGAFTTAILFVMDSFHVWPNQIVTKV